jgi:hypothetical protein
VLELKNKSIADTFNARIRSPWAWVVLAVAVGLTVLFYFSQKPQLIMYSRYIKTLSDYQLQESYSMRAMERVRIGFGIDTVFVQAQTMTLREIAVSFSREMDEIRGLGVKAPSHETVERFEREVLAKVSAMRRYAATRSAWLSELKALEQQAAAFPPSVEQPVQSLLDSARAGYHVGLSGLGDSVIAAIPDSTQNAMASLLQENEELCLAWSRFNNEMAIMYSEDMMQFFQGKIMDEMSLKSKIPMAFYFLTLVLMLSTFFFIFRSKQ